ncbi:hypothetical protein [Streptomyces lycii]|uniref:hypothetical protein n=1 Tax=Streptomyces lycii TaxID=2654337 RepID=UPI001F256A8F|nr:hypothetical protein [Streptomyces lycii]
MSRRHLPTAVGVIAGTLMLMTACGSGGNESQAGDKIEGADDGKKTSASPDPSDPSSAERPDVSVPEDYEMLFDWTAPSDPEQRAALNDAANYLRSIKHGIMKQDADDPAYKFYSVQAASRYARTQIQKWVDGGYTATGTDRYYRPEFSESEDGVLITFCRNQAKAYSKEIETGKVHRTEESLSSFQKFSIVMKPKSASDEVWQAQQIEVEGEVEECRA